MRDLTTLAPDDLRSLKSQLEQEYAAFKAKGLSLNMARGKPSSEQLDLSMPLLDVLNSSSDLTTEDGIDCRNYGVSDGIPEAKRLMAAMLDDDPENVIVMGSSSLNVMYDAMARCLDFGTLGSKPWAQYDSIKWLCPSPGYDRHFGICQAFGIEMIPVTMTEDGPDMDEVERMVSLDDRVKGIWCVPKYSNPGGVTYSKEVVERLASMDTAANDFRIFWDNAYCVHHLFDEEENQDQLFDIAEACAQAGNPDRYFKFASTSKVTFPGAGISGFAASPENVAEAKKLMNPQIIGHDKINQLRHVRFLKDAQGIRDHMAKHAAILRPKFQMVADKLQDGLGDAGIASWNSPRGGYFVSFNAFPGTAKRVVSLAGEAGVTMTGAGATWPYQEDPQDANIRIAPTLPPLDELSQALDVFVCCVKLAAVERLLEQ